MRTLKDFNFKNKRVLVRCDFNVPLDDKGNILDDFRIKKTVPTIEYLMKEGAKIILMAHLGKPDPIFKKNIGEVLNPKSEILKYSLKPVARRLEKILARKINFSDDCVGKKVEKETEEMSGGEILLLENLRFYKGEEENAGDFAEALSKLGDIFINDAFSVSHRKHASIVGIPKYLSSGIGFLVEKETENLNRILKEPEKPFITIVGGRKAETEIKIIDKISEISDFVLLGGLIPKEAEEKNIRFKYPEKIIKPVDWLDSGDIGEETIKSFKEKIKKARTIFWNGPMGKFEEEKFSKGTKEVAKAVIGSRAFSVVGGGETIEYLNKLGLIDEFSFVSTGGGAMLNYLAEGKLVGIDALK